MKEGLIPMKKKKEMKSKKAIMLLMICIALEESKFELSLNEDDENSVNFFDPITDICGCISLKKDMVCNILLIDERDELPSQSIVKKFEKDYHSEFRIDCGSNHNALLFYYNNITIPENTTMHTFQALIMNVVITVLRFRKFEGGFSK